MTTNSTEEKDKIAEIIEIVLKMREEERDEEEYTSTTEEGPDEELVEALIPGSDLDDQDENGLTALHYITALNQTKTAALLLNAGANPNIASNSGIKPIQIAEELGNKAIVEMIENWSANTSHTSSKADEIIRAASPATSVNPKSDSTLKPKAVKTL